MKKMHIIGGRDEVESIYLRVTRKMVSCIIVLTEKPNYLLQYIMIVSWIPMDVMGSSPIMKEKALSNLIMKEMVGQAILIISVSGMEIRR